MLISVGAYVLVAVMSGVISFDWRLFGLWFGGSIFAAIVVGIANGAVTGILAGRFDITGTVTTQDRIVGYVWVVIAAIGSWYSANLVKNWIY